MHASRVQMHVVYLAFKISFLYPVVYIQHYLEPYQVTNLIAQRQNFHHVKKSSLIISTIGIGPYFSSFSFFNNILSDTLHLALVSY